MTAKRGAGGLPGGRAYYRGKDAYAAQSRENESRIVRQVGHVKALLLNNQSYGAGVNTILWPTASLSVFTDPVDTTGWAYVPASGVFVCQQAGRYFIACAFSVTNSSSADEYKLQVRTVRNFNTNYYQGPYTYLMVGYTAASAGAATDIILTSDFDFQAGDQVTVEFNNISSGARTLAGLTGEGTTLETQTLGSFNMWQITPSFTGPQVTG